MTDATTIVRMIESADGHPVLHPSGARMNIKVFAAETGGAYSLMETVLPPGGTVPLHIHEDEDENNFILEGELTMQIGEVQYTAKAGSYVVAPKGITQQFHNAGTAPCRFLTTFTPGGAEGFFKEAGELVRLAAPGKPSADALAALQRKYKLRYLPAA